MVRTNMAIEREIEGAQSIRDAGASVKKKESQSSFSSGKKQKASSSRGFQSHGYLGLPVRQDKQSVISSISLDI